MKIVVVVAVWTGREAATLRRVLRMSIFDFSTYLGVNHKTVSGWEQAQAQIEPTTISQAILDTALSAASVEVKLRFAGLAGDRAVVVVSDSAAGEGNGDESQRRDTFKILGLGGLGVALFPREAIERITGHGERAVDVGLVAAHEDLADAFARLHRGTRSDVLLDQVRAHADGVYELLDRPMGVEDRRRLSVVAVESHVQAATLGFLVGDRTLARRYFDLAGGLARDAHDPALLALALGTSSTLHSSIPMGGVGGDTDRAVELLREATAYARHADAQTRAWVHRWLAMELAASGDERGFHGHMEQAERLSGPGRDRGYPARSLCDETHAARNWGVGLVLLGRPDQAIDALSLSLIPGWSHHAMLVLADTAAARVLQGEPEEACRELRRALGLALIDKYAMGIARIRGVRARFAPAWAPLPCVADLDERLAARRRHALPSQ